MRYMLKRKKKKKKKKYILLTFQNTTQSVKTKFFC